MNNLPEGESYVLDTKTFDLESLVTSGYCQVEGDIQAPTDMTTQVAFTVPDYTQIYHDNNFMSMFFNESENRNKLYINPDFVRDYFDLIYLSESINAQLSIFKSQIKEFIEQNNLGSQESNGMQITYSSPTTVTTIDNKLLKSNYPEIAAACSKVGTRASSISIKASDDGKIK